MTNRDEALAAVRAMWPVEHSSGLTEEQDRAVELFSDGGNLAIEAGAGTGKTTTLLAMAKSTGGIGAYVAFNRAIVEEARRKMPNTVTSSTAHSLAMRAVGHKYRHRLEGGRMKSWDIARRLGIDPVLVTYKGGRKVLAADYLASTVMRAIRGFSFSADEAPGPKHVPYIDGIDMPDDAGRTYANNTIVREYLSRFLDVAWKDISDPQGVLPFMHDHYLKVWQLSEPRIPAEFILFDEAQDAAPVMLAIVAAQTEAQKVFVGDSQQQIYEWRGAVNALASIDSEHRAFLTKSFRFGPAIADVANLVLDELEADLRLTGHDEIKSSVGRCDPVAVLTRTNAEAVTQVLEYQRAGRKVHLVGGGDEIVSFARAADDLMHDRRTWHPELACFATWGEVEEYVERDPQGDELRLLVKLVDDFGVETILRALERGIPERDAEMIVSTAHKSKGREWPRVQLSGDFPTDNLEPGEWRLIYVAATRARDVLDLDRCMPLHEVYSANEKGRQVALPLEASVTS